MLGASDRLPVAVIDRDGEGLRGERRRRLGLGDEERTLVKGPVPRGFP